MKVLTVVSAGLDRPDFETMVREEEANRHPRHSLYQRALNSDILDERFLLSVPRVRRILYRFLPTYVAQLLEAFIIRNRYDVVVTWSEQFGYPFALMLRLTGASAPPHISLNSWISNRSTARWVRLGTPRIDRILLWSSVQRSLAITKFKVPPSKIVFIRKFADQCFFRQFNQKTDIICSAGMEGRDYPTLIEAMRGLKGIKCQIATGIARGRMFQNVKAIWENSSLPPNIEIIRLGYLQLREMYARSRFVVIPLLPSETDHGLTSILEAMAMGKAVICTRTAGQVDVIKEGVTGIFVPCGDVPALRNAINELWHHPEKATNMGLEGRKLLEERFTLEQFVDSVKDVVSEVNEERRAAIASRPHIDSRDTFSNDPHSAPQSV